MTAANEPAELRAGLTWEWQRADLVDYPSPTWVLTYYFKSAAVQFSVVATAGAGGAHSIAVPAATTSGYAAGRYSWVAVVTAGSNAYEADRGTVELQPAYNNTNLIDGRSHARRTLAMVEAYLENPANLTARGYSIAGRSLDRYGVGELLALRDKYRAEVRAEEHAERLRNGQPARNRILVRG